MHVKKSEEIEPAMKQIISILALFFTFLFACSEPEPANDRELLKERVRKSDSLAAVALLDSIKAMRLHARTDTTALDSVQDQ